MDGGPSSIVDRIDLAGFIISEGSSRSGRSSRNMRMVTVDTAASQSPGVM